MSMRNALQFTMLLLALPLLADEPKKEEPKKEAKDPLPEMITKQAEVTIAGKKVPYEVRAGKLRITHDDQTADMFHVAYVRTDVDQATKRPVMFAFNGGPGSSAVWLHIGMLGPKIIDLPGDGTEAPTPPVGLRDNPESILDVCDLVFIDPVSTGYSRPKDEKKANAFHGVNDDIESVGEFIRQWITVNERWGSPKYLIGESYGGVRAAGLSNFLQSRHGMSLNGVILLSSVLDFGTLQNPPGHDLGYSIYLPAYTAVAHHHGKVSGNRDELVGKATEFAYGGYATALIQGSRLSQEQRASIAGKLEGFTGIPANTWLKHDLRIDPFSFRGELLLEEGKTIGRFDARVAWGSSEPGMADADYDPSYSLALGAFATALKDYLGREIGCKEDEPYEILTGKVHPWKWDVNNAVVNVSDRLARAMRDNPKLKVLVMSGHADLATPPECIAHSIRHLPSLPPALNGNITTVFYEAGHMFYLNPPDLKKSRKDLLQFLGNP